MRDFDVEMGIAEYALRCQLAAKLLKMVRIHGYTVASLARAARVTPLQVQRALYPDSYNSVSLRAMMRIAELLGLRFTLSID